MLKVIYRVFTSTPVKIVVRIIASFASAIVVVSGYLFLVNMSIRGKEDEEEPLVEEFPVELESDEEN